MGDFSNGVEQGNNMLGQMSQHNQQIREHNEDRLGQFNQHLKTSEGIARDQVSAGRSEAESQASPEKLAETGTQIGQVGKRMSDSRDVLMGQYGGKFGAFVKGGGRVGTETKLGFGALQRGASNVGDAISSAYRSTLGGPKFRPGAAPPQTTTGAQEALSSAKNEATMGQDTRTAAQSATGTGAGRVDRTSVAAPQYGNVAEDAPARPITATRPSGGDVRLAPGVSADSKAAKSLGSQAAEGVGKLGAGLGMLAGGESLATDLTGGFSKLANKNDKASNALSVAGGAADAIGLAFPPLEIVGGLLGIASAVTGTIGHLEESSSKVGSGQKTLAADKSAKAPPPSETPSGVSSLSALGQVASRGQTVGQKITGSSSF